MLDLYYWGTPNGHKITIFLEEAGLPYDLHRVDIGKGDQFKPDFLAISPNNRIPAIVDSAPKGGGAPISLFESGAICFTSRKKPAALSPPISVAAPKFCNGCSGRWAALAPWPDKTAISTPMRRRKSLTPWNATPRKHHGFMAC